MMHRAIFVTSVYSWLFVPLQVVRHHIDQLAEDFDCVLEVGGRTVPHRDFSADVQHLLFGAWEAGHKGLRHVRHDVSLLLARIITQKDALRKHKQGTGKRNGLKKAALHRCVPVRDDGKEALPNDVAGEQAEPEKKEFGGHVVP
jgi:hypothetical protein